MPARFTVVAALASLLLAGLCRATISDMRATLPGSLHQCEATSVFFFDTDDSGAKTLVFLSSSDSSKLGAGTHDLTSVLSSTSPLAQVKDITSADAAAFPFTLAIAEHTAFETWGFLSNGQGKNLNLPRTVMSPLPGAANCVGNSIAQAATPVVPSSSSSSSPPATSTTKAPGFVSVIKPAATSTSISAVPTTPPPASSSTPPVPANSSIDAPAAPSANITMISTSTSPAAPSAPSVSPVVVKTSYLFTSFIEITNSTASDGTVSSVQVLGGHVTGGFEGTISAFGSALFQHADATNATDLTPEAKGNGTAAILTAPGDETLHLVSTTYMFSTPENITILVTAQTPLANNLTVDSLSVDLVQMGGGTINQTLANLTVLAKPQSINSTMFRLDAYYQ